MKINITKNISKIDNFFLKCNEQLWIIIKYKTFMSINNCSRFIFYKKLKLYKYFVLLYNDYTLFSLLWIKELKIYILYEKLKTVSTTFLSFHIFFLKIFSDNLKSYKSWFLTFFQLKYLYLKANVTFCIITHW